MEFYVDFTNKKWFLNNQFYQDLTIIDVVLEEDYGVLLSDTSHRVIYHSVYRDFRKPFVNDYEYFPDPLIKKMKIVKYYNSGVDISRSQLYGDHYLIGMRIEGISIHKLKRKTPVITCHSRKGVTKNFVLSMNSTACPQEVFGSDYKSKLVKFTGNIF